jgi:hypothetical protein
MKLWVPLNPGNFLNRWGAVSFRKWLRSMEFVNSFNLPSISILYLCMVLICKAKSCPSCNLKIPFHFQWQLISSVWNFPQCYTMNIWILYEYCGDDSDDSYLLKKHRALLFETSVDHACAALCFRRYSPLFCGKVFLIYCRVYPDECGSYALNLPWQFVLHNVTDHMLEQALEIISYSSQMTLTPGECIIKNWNLCVEISNTDSFWLT